MVNLNSRTIGIIITLSLVVIWAFLLSSVDFLFGPFAPEIRTVLTTYYFILILPLAALNIPLPVVKTDLASIGRFASFFIITIVATSIIVPLFVPAATIASLELEAVGKVITFGVFYALVKALIEEFVFRGIIQKITSSLTNPFIGNFIQAVVFGLFHIAVLSFRFVGNLQLIIPALVLLTILGAFWGFINNRFGIWAATGSHVAWNAWVLGLTAAIL